MRKGIFMLLFLIPFAVSFYSCNCKKPDVYTGVVKGHDPYPWARASIVSSMQDCGYYVLTTFEDRNGNGLKDIQVEYARRPSSQQADKKANDEWNAGEKDRFFQCLTNAVGETLTSKCSEIKQADQVLLMLENDRKYLASASDCITCYKLKENNSTVEEIQKCSSNAWSLMK